MFPSRLVEINNDGVQMGKTISPDNQQNLPAKSVRINPLNGIRQSCFAKESRNGLLKMERVYKPRKIKASPADQHCHGTSFLVRLRNAAPAVLARILSLTERPGKQSHAQNRLSVPIAAHHKSGLARHARQPTVFDGAAMSVRLACRVHRPMFAVLPGTLMNDLQVNIYQPNSYWCSQGQLRHGTFFAIICHIQSDSRPKPGLPLPGWRSAKGIWIERGLHRWH